MIIHRDFLLLHIIHFHQPVGRRHGMYHSRKATAQIGSRTLYKADQLKKCRQHTECHNTGLQVMHSPYKSREISCSKTCHYSSARCSSKFVPLHHLILQNSLSLVQAFQYIPCPAQSNYNNTFLKRFLQYGLHTRIRITDI